MSDISKIDNGTEYNLKDAAARNAIQSSKTLKSSVVTVNDAAPINAEDITVDITPIQDLHGYDRPWAGGAGKNLFNPNFVASSVTVNVDNNGYLNINIPSSAATGNIIYLHSSSLKTTLMANTTYTLSCIGSSNAVQVSIRNSNISAVYANVESDTAVQFTPTEDTEVYFVVRIQTNTAQTVVLQPQLEKGSSATTFAPYSNICPIEGWTGAELDRVGKNWWSLLSSYTSTSTGDWVVADTDVFLPAGEYTVSLSDLTTSQNTQFFFKNSLGTVIASTVVTSNGTRNSKIVTFSENVATVAVCMYGSGRTISAIQLELGSAATAYEPYQGQQYNVSFSSAGTVYSGTLDVTTGSLVADKPLVDLKTLNYAGTSAGNLSWCGIDNLNISNARDVLSDKIMYIENENNAWFSQDPCWTIRENNTQIRVYGNTELFTTGEYADSHLLVPLATPQTYQLTPTQIKMLKGINTVYADCGDVSLKYQPDNVIGELKGEIRAVEAELAEVEENLEIVYEDHVANTSMGIIVDGYSVGDMPFSNALDIAKPGYIPIAVTDTSVVLSSVADQGEIATHCLLDVTNNRVRFYVHVMDSAASLTIPPNSLTFRVAYKKA